MTPETRTLLLRVALTLTCMEFFGPMVRDTDHTHALNPEWVGHARVHLGWLLGFMLLSGLANLYFIWFRKPVQESLRLSALWQSCNLGGFWLAVVANPFYDGAITVPGVHVEILGFDENVFVFSILSLIMLGVWLALGAGREAHAAA